MVFLPVAERKTKYGTKYEIFVDYIVYNSDLINI